MKTVNVKLNENSYSIVIGNQIIDQLPGRLKKLSLGNDAVIITDRCVGKIHLAKVTKALCQQGFTVKPLIVPEGEQSKSGPVALRLIEDIARYDVGRKVFIIALGGGVIGDLAGFVAAVYKRGIPYIQVPTTLLAQIDSAIGGKVAIDLSVGKNLAGAFYQPKLVFTDVQFLKTLDDRQIRNGLAEAVKYGVIVDPVLFKYLESHHQRFMQKDDKVLIKVVEACSKIKADVVSKDEKEVAGLRMILNFGHTLGHALENAAGFRYHHGEAVALGMRMAGFISCNRGMCSQGDCSRLENILTAIGLPKNYTGVTQKDILRTMRHDKKFIAGKNRFVLMRTIGKVEVVSGVKDNLIEAAIQKYKK